MTQKHGGPAFPVNGKHVAADYPAEGWVPLTPHEGMSLRDFFAAQALSAVSATFLKDPTRTALSLRNHDLSAADALAIGAYEIADAMLKARRQ